MKRLALIVLTIGFVAYAEEIGTFGMGNEEATELTEEQSRPVAPILSENWVDHQRPTKPGTVTCEDGAKSWKYVYQVFPHDGMVPGSGVVPPPSIPDMETIYHFGKEEKEARIQFDEDSKIFLPNKNPVRPGREIYSYDISAIASVTEIVPARIKMRCIVDQMEKLPQ